MSTDRWMDIEVGCVCVCVMEYKSAIKKEQNNTICSNMDGLRVYHAKWSQRKVSWYRLYVE